MEEKQKLFFILNGEEIKVDAEPGINLLDLLREKIMLTGSKRGCGEGECGACTVIVDNEAVNSCIYPAWKAEGKEVFTVEGLAEDNSLHPLQEAFLEEGAVQCGFCTPGMLMSSYALLQKIDEPGDEDIKEALAGNLCRCTGYAKILNAVKKAAVNMKSVAK